MRYAQLDTPALVVDLDQVDRNLRRIQAVADQAGVKLRPHTKTHKSTYFAKRQLELGAQGLTCAKLGEAEVLAAAGCDDLLIAYPIIGPLKLERLGRLARQVRRLIVSLDSLEVAAGLSALGQSLGKAIEVYAEVDTGLNRVGRAPGEDALAFCRSLETLPGIRLVGLMSHAGPTWKATAEAELLAFAQQEVAAMIAIKAGLGRPFGGQPPAGLKSHGPRRLPPDLEISVGATPIAHLVAQTPGVTEMRPGTYIFGDRNLIGLGLTSEAECALRVLTTVVSHPTPDRAIVDAGSKSLAMDPHRDGGHGQVVGRPDLRVDRLSEEHGVLVMEPGVELHVGDRLEIIPNHVCPAVNLFDQMWAVRDGQVVGPIAIEGRGKNT